MHKLQRGTAPNILSTTKAKKWEEFKSPEKRLVWNSIQSGAKVGLDVMQNGFCAYCERDIKGHNSKEKVIKHIEHFEERECEDGKIFDWNNLFGSCVNSDTCGAHKAKWKDKQNKGGGDGCVELRNANIVKPDADDPENFLIFSAYGGVHPIEGLKTSKPSDYKRAEKTIEIFNLDGHGIVGERRSVIGSRKTKIEEGKEKEYDSGYMDAIEVLCNIPEEKLDLALEYMKTETTKIVEERLPFATAIKHVLTDQST